MNDASIFKLCGELSKVFLKYLLYRDYKQFIGKRLYDRTVVESE